MPAQDTAYQFSARDIALYWAESVQGDENIALMLRLDHEQFKEPSVFLRLLR